jgi:hypothetical protein
MEGGDHQPEEAAASVQPPPAIASASAASPLMPPYPRAHFRPFPPPLLFHKAHWPALAAVLDSYAVNMMSIRAALMAGRAPPPLPHCKYDAVQQTIHAKLNIEYFDM